MSVRQIKLNGKRLRNENDAADYLHEICGYPMHSSKDLETVCAWLKAYDHDILILMDHRCVKDICENKYAYQILMALGRAAEANHHLQIRFDVS